MGRCEVRDVCEERCEERREGIFGCDNSILVILAVIAIVFCSSGNFFDNFLGGCGSGDGIFGNSFIWIIIAVVFLFCSGGFGKGIF